MTEALKNRVKREKENDRLWRVKEILQGAIASYPYNEELYLEYAKVLFDLGNYLESGKYFLLTSSKDKKHHQAIGLFLSRHNNETCFFQFPRQFRKVEPQNYPENLKKIFSQNDFFKKHILSAQKLAKEEQLAREQPDYHMSKKEKFIISFFFGIAGLIFFIGLITSVKFLWSLI